MVKETFGPFIIEATLGQGGMGEVCLASHPVHGRVALKRPTSRAKAFARDSLRAEIRALSRLNHPGVVKLLAHGSEAGIPWLAMELIEGMPLSAVMTRPSSPKHDNASTASRHTLASHWTANLAHTLSQLPPSKMADAETTCVPTEAESSGLPDEEVTLEPSGATLEPSSALASTLDGPRRLVVQRRHEEQDERASNAPQAASMDMLLGWLVHVCQAVSYLHGQGLVHADLKPSNILITSEPPPHGRAVVVDFGLALPFGSKVDVKTLTRAGLAAGSILYMSPEQCLGQPLDARSDLYALGCMLFEILTGRTPLTFHEARDLDQLVEAQQRLDPLALLNSLEVKLPEAWATLGPLAEGMLSTRPEQRTGRAQMVLRALEAAGIASEVHEPGLEGRPYLHKPLFTGRDTLLGELLDAATETLNTHQGRMVLLRGESGVGKTRLAQEVIRKTRLMNVDGFAVVVGYSASSGSGLQDERPLGLFVPILRAAVDACLASGRASRSISPEDIAVLGPFAPFMQNMPGVATSVAPLPQLPPEQAQLRVFTHLVDVIKQLAGGRPLLMVLDDLQWSDPLSLSALEFIEHHVARDTGWFLLGLCRTEEVSPALEGFVERRAPYQQTVERLDHGSVTRLLGQMLGEVPDPQLTQALATKAGGNAFFAAEYLRAVVDSRLLDLDAQGRWHVPGGQDALEGGLDRLPEPGSVQTLLADRLGRLSDGAQQLCQAAAVLGKRTTTPLLCAVAGLEGEPFDRGLDELMRLQILEHDATPSQAPTSLQFIHDALRETTYARTLDGERTMLHLRAARTLDAQEEGDPAVVALHWIRGGELALGRSRTLEAAQRSVSRLA
ncbi:MAG: protein kinase, partial [Myxococcota bacterium]